MSFSAITVKLIILCITGSCGHDFIHRQIQNMKPVDPHFYWKQGYNQHCAVILLMEEEIPSNFTFCVICILFGITEFTANKTLTGRILIEMAARFHLGIPKMPGFHYKSIFHLIIKYSVSYTNSIYMSKYEMYKEYSRIQIRHLSNSFQAQNVW